jgi:CBS domain containing-hemolysin-like protein
MIWAWHELVIQRRHERFLWTVMLTLTITHLIGLRTASPHFIVFMMPLLFYLARWGKQRQPQWMGLTLFGLLVVPWLHFITTIGTGKFEHPTVFLPLPILTFVTLIITRRWWWQHQPPEQTSL